MKKNLTEKIPDILLALLITFSLVYALTSSLCLTYPLLNTLIIVIICITVLYFMFYNRISSIISTVTTVAFVLTTGLYILFSSGLDELTVFMDDYFFWLGDYIRYPSVSEPMFELITVLALCAIIAVFSYIFVIRKFMFIVIITVGMVLFSVQWSYKIVSSLVPFYLFLSASLIAYLRHVYIIKSSRGPNEYTKTAGITLWSLPVCILVISLSSMIQASNKPIEWKWLDQKIVSVYNYLKKNLDYETFDYFSLSASSGFGDRNSLLGGRVRLDRTNVLYVTTGSRVYLKGVSKDVYTGSNWINSSPALAAIGTDYSSMYSDYEEMMQGMKILSEKDDFLEEYFETNNITVSFMNIRTKSVFIPSKVKEFKPADGYGVGFISTTGDFSSDERLSKGFKYMVEMYSPKVGNDKFIDLMRKSRGGLYSDKLLQLEFPSYYTDIPEEAEENPDTIATDALPDTQASSSDNGSTGAMIESDDINLMVIDPEKLRLYEELTALKEKSDSIYGKYLQLPETLPQRIRDLSASLTASADNNYDKAKAIEQYLASNFPYNLDVLSTPRNRDFVDYFLFDQKEGYCSYFASAMAILARCAGLPARYVEGYMLPPEPVKDSTTSYVVTNMQAHAWVEIYFEGYGWLPFEPTSPFRSKFYENEVSQVYYGEGYNSAYFDYMELMKMYSGQSSGNIDIDGIEAAEKPSILFIALTVFSSLLLLFFALLLFNVFRNRFKLYKLTNLPPRECILGYYDYFEKVLRIQGLGLMPAETPFQYSSRIDSLMFFSPVKFRVITDAFAKSRYSRNEVTENEKQLFCNFIPGFLSEIKINMGRFKYFVNKYLLGRF